MGAEAPAWRVVLRVCLPRPAHIRVLRDGAPFREARAAALNLDIEARGVYRAEARIDGRLWLLSKPIHRR